VLVHILGTLRYLCVSSSGSASVYIWGYTVVRKVTTSVVLYPSFSNPGKTEDSLAIARDADEMVFFTPS
jgi:hypothetical protein